MNFVNNWQRLIILAAGATSIALDLPSGNYRLTLADSATAPTRWEIVDAAVLNGDATLLRGQEGTADQDWPNGSVIYNAVTAGTMEQIMQLLTQFDQRIRALEGEGHLITVADNGALLGYFRDGEGNKLGDAKPMALEIPGLGQRQLSAAAFMPAAGAFVLAIDGGQVPDGLLATVNIEGYGDLNAADADYTASAGNDAAQWTWSIAGEAPWAAADQRRLTLIWSGGAENQLTDSTGQPMTDSQGNPLTLSTAGASA